MPVSKSEMDALLQVFTTARHQHAFEIVDGTGPVIVSAPHSVEQTRKGAVKHGEYQTGVLCKLLHRQLQCPIAYKLQNNQDDANYDAVCNYKTALVAFVRKNHCRFLLDLHQMAPFRPEMINIGTGKGRNIYMRQDLVGKMTAIFTARAIWPVTIDTPFNAAFPHTVSATIARECQIPCFQIEINSRLLSDHYPEYNFDAVLAALSDIVQDLQHETRKQ